MTIVLRVFLLVWALLWTAGLPAVLFYLWRRGRKDPVYWSALAERFGRYDKALAGAVWVHAVSLGELRSAVPLIRGLLDQGHNIVTTHFTPAGRSEAEKVFSAEIAAGRVRAVWVPFDVGWALSGFFRTFRPAYGLVMEIEIWPGMVFSARKHGVPLFMCNAQYPENSLRRDSGGLRLRQQVMQGFAGALVKSDLQANRFAGAGVRNIAVTGELRFDQPVPHNLVREGVAARRWIGAGERRVICIASAIEGEDEVYLRAINDLNLHCRENGLPKPLVVYVPRRPERFDEVAQMLASSGFSVLRRSGLGSVFSPDHWPAIDECPDIFLGDSLGEMYGYLAMADQVIVGGGFSPKGAHNISEALVLGKPVVTGPHTHTIEFPFAEARAAGVAASVLDAAALSAWLIRGSYPNPKAIADFVATQVNATERTLHAIPRLLSAVKPS
ncbi:3-deoxy-D-manno-octulosonic acid transferase [Thioclava sp. FR2]|uniref:3-deoxy-D-manno-octulosonic acid transferase n=1 Tax=Thioclava sp. FR2 TaxID=3445780 RepID=UPI003EBF9EDD